MHWAGARRGLRVWSRSFGNAILGNDLSITFSLDSAGLRSISLAATKISVLSSEVCRCDRRRSRTLANANRGDQTTAQREPNRMSDFGRIEDPFAPFRTYKPKLSLAGISGRGLLYCLTAHNRASRQVLPTEVHRRWNPTHLAKRNGDLNLYGNSIGRSLGVSLGKFDRGSIDRNAVQIVAYGSFTSAAVAPSSTARRAPSRDAFVKIC